MRLLAIVGVTAIPKCVDGNRRGRNTVTCTEVARQRRVRSDRTHLPFRGKKKRLNTVIMTPVYGP